MKRYEKQGNKIIIRSPGIVSILTEEKLKETIELLKSRKARELLIKLYEGALKYFDAGDK